MLWTLLPTFLATLLSAAPIEISWEASYAAARERASAESRVLFVAVLEPQEARSRAFVRELYKDREVQRFCAETVNLVGVSGALGTGGKVPIKGFEWEALRRIEADVREAHLSENSAGAVATPQHLWLDAKGEVLLCVPFEMTASELVWCFHEAQRLVDPAAAGDRPEGARAPRRLLVREVYTAPASENLSRGRTPDELDALLAEQRTSWVGGRSAWAAILFTAEDDAAEYAERELGSGFARWGGSEFLGGIVHSLGLLLHADHWEALGRFATDRAVDVRREAAVAFEQLGAPDALKVVRKAQSAEKEPELRAAWLRALAATGHADKRTRGVLLKELEREDDAIVRANLIFALGHLDPDDGVQAVLAERLAGDVPGDRIAAACAMALSRHLAHLGPLQTAVERTEDEELRGHFEAALEVVKGAGLHRIRAAVRKVCADEVERERLFFRSVGEGPPRAGGR